MLKNTIAVGSLATSHARENHIPFSTDFFLTFVGIRKNRTHVYVQLAYIYTHSGGCAGWWCEGFSAKSALIYVADMVKGCFPRGWSRGELTDFHISHRTVGHGRDKVWGRGFIIGVLHSSVGRLCGGFRQRCGSDKEMIHKFHTPSTGRVNLTYLHRHAHTRRIYTYRYQHIHLHILYNIYKRS